MRKTFSAHQYNPENDEWQIVIVGVNSDEKTMIKHYLEKVICGRDNSEEHFSLMRKPEKKEALRGNEWEESKNYKAKGRGK